MALVTCPECGKEISDKATTCPYCGFPMDSKEVNKVETSPSSPKLTTKTSNKRFAKFLVFDNCSVGIVKKAFRLAAKQLGKAVDSSNIKAVEPVLTIALEKWVNLMYYDSTKFKSKRTITSISQIAKIEQRNTDFSLPPLDRVAQAFKDAITKVDSSVVLFEESGYVDITKSYTQAHYQHIFDKEIEMIGKDKDNVRTKREEKSYKQSIGFNAKQEEKIREVAHNKVGKGKSTQHQIGAWNNKRIFSTIATILILVLFWLYQAGALGPHIKGVYEFDYYGHPQKVIIPSNKTEGPCPYYVDGERSQESYNYYKHVFNRPVLYIHECALIDIKNKKVYFSEPDFQACRNGVSCRIHK